MALRIDIFRFYCGSIYADEFSCTNEQLSYLSLSAPKMVQMRK